MPLTVSFTATQSSGNPSVLLLQDTSVGSDVLVTSRLVSIVDAQGNTTTYPWAYPATALSLNILTEDAALDITVEWLNVIGTALYTDPQTFGFTAYNETFLAGLTSTETPITNPSVSMSTNYYQNKSQMRCYVDSGDKAISRNTDIYSAQSQYDLATNMRLNATFYF